MPASTIAELSQEVADLRVRLEEAERTIRAIRSGEVDAFVIYDSPAEKVFLLEGADSPYRLLMDEMEQGACTLTEAGQILYCNQRLATLLRTAPETITGRLFSTFLQPEDHPRLASLVGQALVGSAKAEFVLRGAAEIEVPVRLAGNRLTQDSLPIVALLVTDLTEHRHLKAQLDHSADQLRRLAARLRVVQEEERTRIAREIHDELGGSLTGFKLDLAQLRKRLPKKEQDLLAKVDALSQSADDTIQRVRRIATDLRPAILDDLGLVEAIEWQLKDFQTHSRIACTMVANVEHVSLSPESGTAIFRVFQEALTNVARHAQANQVEVQLEQQSDYLRLQIRDNGRGIAEHERTGTRSLGLLGMRERIHLLAGEFDITGSPGRGTTLQLRIPLKRPHPGPATG